MYGAILQLGGIHGTGVGRRHAGATRLLQGIPADRLIALAFDGIYLHRGILRDNRGVHVLLGRNDRIGRIDRTAGLVSLALIAAGDRKKTENRKRGKLHR